MKIFNKLLFICCLFFATVLFAQQDINTSFATQMDATFSAIDKTKVPNGILLDYGMEFTNVPAFNGILSDSTYVNNKNIREIYNTLLMSRIRNVSDGFVTPATFDTNWQQARSTDYISLSGLYFKYGAYSDDALTTGKVNLINAKFYDVVGKNPYIEKKTFAIASPIDVYTGYTVNVKLPQNVFYTNAATEIQKIEIDLGDGLGYRLIGFNQIVLATYTSEGIKTWLYKLTLTNGQSLLAQSKIVINQGLNVYNADNQLPNARIAAPIGGITSRTITAITSLSGTALGNAVILVDDAGNDGIKKPLIVVEGFDMDKVVSPENLNGQNDFSTFIKNVYKTESSNLRQIITGNDRDISGDQVYDIIYVKWQNGLDYIQNNAYVLQEIIKYVNQQKANNGSTEKNVIIGQSMGGLVVRFALKDMEQKGLSHQTRLYVNQDGPQQGANIPLGYQAAYRHVRSIYARSPVLLFGGEILAPLFTGQSASQFLNITDQPATRQLLKNRLDTNYNLENSLYTSFQAELKTKGYPQAEGIRNIAISNGSECGNTQTFNAGDKLLGFNYYKGLSFWGDLLSITYNSLGGVIGGGLLFNPDLVGSGILGLAPGHSTYNADIYCNSLSYTPNATIYHNKISYTKKILWIGPKITVNIVNKNVYQPSNVLPFDYYPGGYIDVHSYTGTTSAISGVGNFTIVPVTSTLDLGNGNVSFTDSDYKTSYVGTNPPTSPKNSPFANFITANNAGVGVLTQNGNESHLQYTKRNGDWLAAELNNSSYTSGCSFMCSPSQITGNDMICLTAIYSIPNLSPEQNVTWSIAPSNFASITVSNNQATVTPSQGTGQATLTATINSDCGTRQVQKLIIAGIPDQLINIMEYQGILQESDFYTNRSYSFETKSIVPNGISANYIYDFDSTASYIWRVIYKGPFGNDTIYNLGTYAFRNNPFFYFDQAGTYDIVLDIITNNCSQSRSFTRTITVQDTFGYTVSPNPSSNNITIQPLSNSTNKTTIKGLEIQEVELVNKMGVVSYRQKFNKGSTTATLSVNALPNDLYVLRIFDGKIWHSHKVLVQH